MSVESKIRKKLRKTEQCRFQMINIQNRKEELQHALEELDKAEKEFNEELYKLEDYFIEHYASARSCVIEIVKGQLIEIVIGHYGNTTYAVYNGLVCTAKLHPDDKDNFDPGLGETIAVQRLINKLLEINFGIII